MRTKDLAVSPVVFDNERHTYTLLGKELSGITGIISKYICPNKYSNVPEEVLEKAREHGTLVHQQIQMAFTKATPPEPTEEFKAFVAWRGKARKRFIASEYLVSDEKEVASSIDLVDTYGNLYDIKTTAELDIEYLRWQLSIYKYLFIRQNKRNPNAEMHLYALHLRGSECKVVEVQPIPQEHVVALLNAYALGLDSEDYVNPLHHIEDEEDLSIRYRSIVDEIEILSLQLAELEKKKDDVKSKLVEQMDSLGITKHESQWWRVTRTPDRVQKKFNVEQFAKDHERQYAKYLIDQKVKGRLTITLK